MKGPEFDCRIGRTRQALLAGTPACFCLFFVVVSFAESDPESRRAAAVTAAILGALSPGMLLLALYPRLLVNASGIEVRQVGWRVQTTWDKVERLVMSRSREGLVLSEPLAGGARRALRAGLCLPGWYGPEEAGLVAEDRWIPLAPFSAALRRGALRSYMERHVPGPFS